MYGVRPITGLLRRLDPAEAGYPAAEEAIANINIKVEIGKGAGTLLIDDVVLNGEAPLPPKRILPKTMREIPVLKREAI